MLLGENRYQMGLSYGKWNIRLEHDLGCGAKFSCRVNSSFPWKQGEGAKSFRYPLKAIHLKKWYSQDLNPIL